MAVFNRFYALFIAAGMLLFGTMNTIFTKYQGFQSFECVEYDCEVCPENANEEQCVGFDQPVFQTFIMFVGELVCFVVYYSSYLYQYWKSKGEYKDSSKLTGLRKFVFVIPTLCDMVATTLMNLGLLFTYASIFQMLRGAVVVFTAILSIIFLKRKQYIYHWLGISLVIIGVAIVGLAAVLMIDNGDDGNQNAIGVALILFAQTFTASQFIIEEHYLSKYEVPALQAVGFEGLFGVTIIILLTPLFQFAISPAFGKIGNYFDLKFAFTAFLEFPSITVSSIGSICSISLFNFFGLTITKVLSATARSTIDALRTLSVWAFGLAIGWEDFLWPQIIGFLILVVGTTTYNKVLKYPCFKYEEVKKEEEESKPLNHPTANSSDSDTDDEKKRDINYSAIN